jgi:hypothetical protein
VGAKTLWAGITVLIALLSSAPSSKAQEVNPEHFTDTGVDGVWPRPTSPKKTVVKRSTLSAKRSDAQKVTVRKLPHACRPRRRKALTSEEERALPFRSAQARPHTSSKDP